MFFQTFLLKIKRGKETKLYIPLLLGNQMDWTWIVGFDPHLGYSLTLGPHSSDGPEQLLLPPYVSNAKKQNAAYLRPA